MSKPRSRTAFAFDSPASSSLRLRGDVGDELGGVLGVGLERLRVERRDTLVLRVGVGERRVETGAAQHDEHAVLALVAEEHLGPVEMHAVLQLGDDGGRFVVGKATGAAVGDGPVGGERAQVAAGGDVARSQLEVEPGRAQCAAAQLEALGVVAEEAEVTGPRAGRDAGTDRLHEPGRPFGGELIEVRRRRFLELGAVLAVGVAAEPVHHDEQDLGVRGLDQRRDVHVDHGTARARRESTWSARGRARRRLSRRRSISDGSTRKLRKRSCSSASASPTLSSEPRS